MTTNRGFGSWCLYINDEAIIKEGVGIHNVPHQYCSYCCKLPYMVPSHGKPVTIATPATISGFTVLSDRIIVHTYGLKDGG